MAKRDKLTKQQKRRVSARKQALSLPGDDSLGDIDNGIVISRYGHQADIADRTRRVHRCHLRQHLGGLVSGDRVAFRSGSEGDGVVESVEPRTSQLTRPTPHGGVKTIVANVDQILVVTAARPEFSDLLLDRYLVACQLAGLPVIIVFNKSDLVEESKRAQFDQLFESYQAIGYSCIRTSTKNDHGVEQLQALTRGKENILVGQSGVGKSSLINRLLPNSDAQVNEVSANSNLGTHTTTTSRVYFLPDSGHIIDSPGVREFALTHIEPEQLIEGFIELNALAVHCKFRNCRHINEKGCAVQSAADKGDIEMRRLNNYRKIYHQMLEPR